VQQLWNWLLPPLFGWAQVTFWQALGLLALCRILFGGFRVGGHSGSHIRNRMADRWARMTPEERERFKTGMRARWCAGAKPGDTQAGWQDAGGASGATLECGSLPGGAKP
jgi:uncharacterized membrane protein